MHGGGGEFGDVAMDLTSVGGGGEGGDGARAMDGAHGRQDVEAVGGAGEGESERGSNVRRDEGSVGECTSRRQDRRCFCCPRATYNGRGLRGRSNDHLKPYHQHTQADGPQLVRASGPWRQVANAAVVRWEIWDRSKRAQISRSVVRFILRLFPPRESLPAVDAGGECQARGRRDSH